jgi:hypothetical protein
MPVAYESDVTRICVSRDKKRSHIFTLHSGFECLIESVSSLIAQIHNSRGITGGFHLFETCGRAISFLTTKEIKCVITVTAAPLSETDMRNEVNRTHDKTQDQWSGDYGRYLGCS